MTQKTSTAYEKIKGAAVTRDGITLHYTCHGDHAPSRPRIVLVHSLAMNREVWQAVAERLVSEATVLTYDCRGHGASTQAPAPYRVETFANDLADLLTQVGWDSAHLAGASMGGSVALQFAVSYPQRVRTLGLVDTTAWYGAEAADRWSWRAQEAQSKGLAGLLKFQQTRWFTDKFREQCPDLVALCSNAFLSNSVACFAATCGMLGAFDLRQQLASLHMPTAVVVGEEDYATPPDMARVLKDGIAGATLLIVPNARHLTFVERPDVVAKALSELMKRAPSLK